MALNARMNPWNTSIWRTATTTALAGWLPHWLRNFCQINTEGTEVSKINRVTPAFTITRRPTESLYQDVKKRSKIATFEAFGIKNLVFREVWIFGIPWKSFKFPKKFKLPQRITLPCQAPQTWPFCHFWHVLCISGTSLFFYHNGSVYWQGHSTLFAKS